MVLKVLRELPDTCRLLGWTLPAKTLKSHFAYIEISFAGVLNHGVECLHQLLDDTRGYNVALFIVKEDVLFPRPVFRARDDGD